MFEYIFTNLYTIVIFYVLLALVVACILKIIGASKITIRRFLGVFILGMSILLLMYIQAKKSDERLIEKLRSTNKFWLKRHQQLRNKNQKLEQKLAGYRKYIPESGAETSPELDTSTIKSEQGDKP